MNGRDLIQAFVAAGATGEVRGNSEHASAEFGPSLVDVCAVPWNGTWNISRQERDSLGDVYRWSIGGVTASCPEDMADAIRQILEKT